MRNHYDSSEPFQVRKFKKLEILHKGLLMIGMMLVISLQSYAQERVIQGKVSDSEDGSGLPGVNILLEGTSNGTITDIDGNYKLTISDEAASLVFTYVGYKKQIVPINGRSAIDISMALDSEILGEVVVIGYGSVEKKDVTGVIATVEEKQFNRGIIGSPDKLLTGKVAGLQISQNGEPGAATEIRLRGRSMNGETPLFVIDGVPLNGPIPGDIRGSGVAGGRNPLNFMNPNDVESITVLKDASAAAIYGSRGANGVIIITTKNGQSGKMKIQYSGYYSVSNFTQKVGNLTPNQFRDAIFAKAPGEFADLGEINTDWVDRVTQVATGMQHNISVSGGKNKSTYFASLNYLDDKGVLRNTSNKNATLSLKFNQKLLNDNLSIRLNTKNGITRDRFTPDVIGDAFGFDPTRPVFDTDPDNPFGGYFQWNDALAATNPVSKQDLNDQTGETFRSITNLEVEYNLPFLPGLSFNANLGYDYNDGNYTSIESEFRKSSVANDRGTSVRFEDATKKNKLLETFLNYKKDIGFVDGNINATLGYSWQNFRSDFVPLAGDNALLNDSDVLVPTNNIDDKIEPVENRLISFYARVILDIKSKYLFTLSVRRDGSTKFGDSNKWGLFPAAAFAWRVIDEDFASGLTNTFSDLKLRIGYGVTGNQAIENYRYATFYKFSQDDAAYQFGNEFVNTVRPIGVDPNIKWEENISTNFGLDMGLFGGRINASLDYYIKKVNDLLLDVNLPAGTNLSDRVITNIGEVENSGFELTLDAVVYDKQDFQWDLGFNIATNKNEVTKINNNSNPDFGGFPRGPISGDVGQTIQVLKVGEEVEAFSTFVHRRDANGDLIVDENGDGTQSLLELYVDQLTEDTDGDGIADSGDGIINEKDLVITGSPNPNLLVGLTSNMQYKRFDLSMSIRGNFGHQVYNNVSSANGYFQRLTDRETNNIHKSAFTTNFKNRQLKSDYYIEDASFIKLDNITLGYSFQVGSKIGAKAYVTAQNVLTISGYSGVNPEIFNGIDNNLYPRATTFIVGVNANF